MREEIWEECSNMGECCTVLGGGRARMCVCERERETDREMEIRELSERICYAL